jgi:hypothetical protein
VQINRTPVAYADDVARAIDYYAGRGPDPPVLRARRARRVDRLPHPTVIAAAAARRADVSRMP